jgi:hypothetical protein
LVRLDVVSGDEQEFVIAVDELVLGHPLTDRKRVGDIYCKAARIRFVVYLSSRLCELARIHLEATLCGAPHDLVHLNLLSN